MVATSKNSVSRWHCQSSIKKGDFGESLVEKYFETKGFVSYKPVTDAKHGFDRYLYKDGKQLALEVKTKPKCSKYDETGFEERLYQRYLQLSNANNMPVIIAFVDESTGTIYGNWLSELNKPLKVDGKDYPLVVPHSNGKKLTRYFPMKSMKLFRKLSNEEISTLKKLNRS